MWATVRLARSVEIRHEMSSHRIRQSSPSIRTTRLPVPRPQTSTPLADESCTLLSGRGVVTPGYYTVPRSIGMFPTVPTVPSPIPRPWPYRRHLPLHCHSHPRCNGRQLFRLTSLAHSPSHQSSAAGRRFQDTPPIYSLQSGNIVSSHSS